MPLPSYTGQAVQPSMGMRDPGMSPEEKLASMRELLSPDMLGLLARLIQSGARTPPPQPQQWDNLHPMPPPPKFTLEGINGALPMRPTEPAQMPMMNPGFVRG